MAGILDQAGLSQAPQAGLTPTPQSTVSAGELVGPMRQVADALGFDSRALDEASVPMNQEAGRQAAVTRGPDGSVDVTSKLLPFNTGAGAAAYNAAVMQGGLAMGQNAVTAQIADMHSKHLGDPAGFKKEADAYIATLGSTGDATLRPMLVQDANRLATQHFDNLTSTVASAALTNSATAIQSRIQDEKNQMLAMARQDGTGTDAFKASMGRLHDLYQSLGTNPLFGYPQDKIDQDLKSFDSLTKGEMVVGDVDRSYTKQGKAAAQKILTDQILNNPQLDLTDPERKQLYGWGMSRLQFLDGEHKAQVDANKQTATALIGALAHPGHNIPDSQVDDAITTARNLGDSETALKLDAARRVNGASGVMSAGAGLTDEQRVRTFGPAGGNPAVAPAGNPAGVSLAPQPAVAQAITAAAQKNGVPVQVLDRIAQTESSFDPNANAGNSKAAKGLFQFIPGTWKQFGAGGDVFDPVANADAAARLYNANKATLTKELGREPTPGEIYLAHQQGAGSVAQGTGAAALLANPNEPAVNIVGKAALLGNGGTLGMTAGQFATLWTRKFDNPGAPPLPGSNSGPVASASPTPAGAAYPFSPADIRANPFLLSAYTKAMVEDQNGMVQSASRVSDAIQAGLKRDMLPAPTTLANVMQLAQQYPDKLGQTRDNLISSLQGWDAGQKALGLPSGQGAAVIDQAKRAAQGAPIMQQKAAEAMQDAYQRGVANMDKDPTAEGARRGWYNPVAPLDMSTPQSIAQGVADRGMTAQVRTSRMGGPAQPAFGPAELPAVKDVVTNGTLDAKTALLSSVAQLPPDVAKATFQKLAAGDDDSKVFAVAGSVNRFAPDVAKDILAGQSALKQQPKFAPKDDGSFETSFSSKLPANMLGQSGSPALDAIRKSALAYYAAQSAKANDVTGVLNDSRMNAALTAVTGGVLDSRSSKIVAPWYGATQDDLDGTIRSLQDSDFAGARTTDGSSFPAAALKPGMFSRMYYGDWRLQSAGDGKYRVISGPDDAPVTLMNGRMDAHDLAGPFILDLSQRGKPTGAPAIPPSSGANVMPTWPAQPVGGVEGR